MIGPITKADKNMMPGKKNLRGIDRFVKQVIAIATTTNSKKTPISYSFFAKALWINITKIENVRARKTYLKTLGI